MWGAILGRYIRQNQPTLPSWRLNCFNMEWFASGVHWWGNPVISKETSILCYCSWWTLWTLSLNNQEGSWHSFLKRLRCWLKSCAKLDSLLRKTCWIFRTRLHVHLKKWTLKFKQLYLLNRICYFNKIAEYVDWILIYKLCKFGKYICYNFIYIIFFLGGYFYLARPILFNIKWC